ncbi:nucleotidyltransferase family protein [Bacillus sp. JJ1764]|uniref:nucleotidyltransferase family protein n=1 Tax=Bacillus sp. JJ1764 TaxID=3122964 RepID=UPI002FFD722F
MCLELVSILYDSNKLLPREASFYQNAIQAIEEDGTSSQFYFLLKQQGRLDQTPAFFQQFLKQQYEQSLFLNLFIKQQTEQLLKCFESQEIAVIPLKGVYFAEKYFGHTGARATSDIDLLIKQSDVNKAIQLINSLGFYVEEEQIPGHFHCSFSKPLPNSTIPLVVELHWSLVKEQTSRFSIEEIWQQATHIGQSNYIHEMSPNHTFYTICLHGWRHNMNSMKYFFDILQVIQHDHQELDLVEIFQLAQSHETFKRMHRTLSIVYLQFPFLEIMMKYPLKKRRTLWAYRPVKGFKMYLDFLDYQFLSYDKVKHSVIELGNWLWPSKYEMSNELDLHAQGASEGKMLLTLYKKRISGIFNRVSKSL